MADKTRRPDIDSEKASKIKDFINLARGDQNKVDHIAYVPDHVVQKASLISAHFLLPSNAKVVDIGCGNGQVTYAMALLNPLRNFIGIDHDRGLIDYARSTYQLPNLTFKFSDARLPDFEDNSLDGVINSNVLHEVYSAHNRDPDVLSDMMSAQIKKLKPGGVMLIRDYMMPPNDEYVLLELPDFPSIGKEPEDLSYADLLIEYSQTARPMEDGGAEGFYLEELDPGILRVLNPTLKKIGAYEMTEQDKERLGADFTFDEDKSRIFRLLHKWAVEFIRRKDERHIWKERLDKEYTFFTGRDYQRELARMGMRFVFSAPYRNPWVVNHFYKGKFRLYTEEARLLPPPATNYFIVAQKIPEEQSLVLDERRPSQNKVENLEIITVRENKSGSLQELARRPGEHCDIIPWRMTADGRLVIYVRSGYPRPIINAVKRGNANLDSKNWSGHLIEPITMDTDVLTRNVAENRDLIIKYAEDHASLEIKKPDSMYVGQVFYPSPDRIDEAIEPVFMEVKKPKSSTWDIGQDQIELGFRFGGKIVELDANDIIRAAQVGLLPEPRLELHVFDLMRRLNIDTPPWVTGEIIVDRFRKFDENDVPDILKQENILSLEKLIDEWEPGGFSPERIGGNHLKTTRSVFVEEGKFGGAMRGMASQDYEFLVTEDGVENIAVVMPLTRGWDDQLMVGVQVNNMAVPQRLGGSGLMVTSPSFVIPRDVRTIEDAKIFVGNQFGVGPENVFQVGESYFTHTGITPQRIYPFAVADPGHAEYPPHMKYTAAKKLGRLLYCFEIFSGDFVKDLTRLHMMLGEEHGLSPDRDLDNRFYKEFELNTDKTQMQRPGERHAPLSRVLGERNGADSDPTKRVYDQKKAREAQPKVEPAPTVAVEKEKPPVSLRKKPTEKLSLNFNPEEKNDEIKDVSPEASEDLKQATEGISDSIKKQDQSKKPVLRATRPDPNL